MKFNYKVKNILWICVLVCAVILSGCTKNKNSAGNDRIKVVCTIFPEYDWVRQISGSSDIDIYLLMKNGVDLHSFQPSAADIVSISDCDIFIYVGGESDGWVSDALSNVRNRNMKVINLMDSLSDSVKEEEIVEGMQVDEDDEHSDENHSDEEVGIHLAGHTHDDVEYDEHVWLSLRNAEKACLVIAESLCELEPENESLYMENLASYTEELRELDSEYQNAVSASEMNTLVFCDRFPFRYMTDDYGLKYYAAFAGCSAETEASFETVAFLSSKIDELGVKSVFIIETSDGKLARTVIQNSSAKDCQIITLDSLQSVNSRQIEEGRTYLSSMRSNLELLRQAL